jgi:acyl dehydratase
MTATAPAASQAITDDAIARMREELHRPWSTEGWNSVASRDAVWHFAHGVGDDNPLWWDRQRPGGLRVPPVFLYSCDNAPIVPGLLQTAERGGVDTWLPGALGLWAGDRWVWHEPIRIDEPIAATAELYDVAERESRFSGRSVAQTVRTEYRGEGDRLLAECFRTIFRFERSAMNPDQYLSLEPPRYSAADRADLRRQYLAEAGNRRGTDPRYWEDVQPDDTVPTLLKGPLTVTVIVSWVLGWGSPMCQPSRIGARFLEQNPGAGIVHPRYGFEDTIEGPHWDDELAHLGGFPSGYDFGSQRISWLAHCATDWCGDAGTLRELDARLLRPNLIGDITRVGGRVAAKEHRDGRALVTLDLQGRNQRDEVTVTGTAVVELPARPA